MKSIDNKATGCKHKILKFIGNQDDAKGGFIKLGNCHYCNSTLTITDDYKEVVGNIYERIKDKVVEK